jgi:hypothetical protein
MDATTAIPSLVSPWLSLLGLLLPSVGLTGVWLARRCLASPGTRRVVALPLSLTAWMLATHLIARATGSFTAGVTAGTVLAAIPGTLELGRAWQRARALRRWLPVTWRRYRTERLIWLATFALLALPIFRDQFHDEVSLAGQHSTIEQMLIGSYPPRLTFFPTEELRYHLGFNVLAGLIAAVFRVSAPLAIDLLSSLLLVSILRSLAHIGRVWLGARKGSWVALFGFFAGGVTFFATPANDTLGARLAGSGAVHYRWLGPPISSYFFQHPFALGMALGLAAYAAHIGKARRDRLRRFVVLGALLIGLALAQVAIAAVFGAALLLAEAFDGERLQPRGALGGALVLATLAAIRPWFGGWFVPSNADTDAASIVFSLGPVDEPLQSLSWLAQTLGLLLPLGLWGLSSLRRGRFAALLIVAFGLGLGTTLKYVHSWDMVKLIAVAQIVLGSATGALIISRFPTRERRASWRRRTLLGATALVVLHAGIAFPLAVGLALPGAAKTGRRLLISPDWREAITLLRSRMRPDDIVYERPGRANMVNQFGLMVPHFGEVARKLGIVGPRAAERLALLGELPADARRWREAGIRWFALEPDDPLSAKAEAWLERGDAELVARCGTVTVLWLP